MAQSLNVRRMEKRVVIVINRLMQEVLGEK